MLASRRYTYTREEEAIAYALASAIRGFMPSMGPPPHKGYNPKTNESNARLSRAFLLQVHENTYSWDRVRPLVAEKKKKHNFRLLLEEERLSPQRVLLCIGDLLDIYKQIKPLGMGSVNRQSQ